MTLRQEIDYILRNPCKLVMAHGPGNYFDMRWHTTEDLNVRYFWWEKNESVAFTSASLERDLSIKYGVNFESCRRVVREAMEDFLNVQIEQSL